MFQPRNHWNPLFPGWPTTNLVSPLDPFLLLLCSLNERFPGWLTHYHLFFTPWPVFTSSHVFPTISTFGCCSSSSTFGSFSLIPKLAKPSHVGSWICRFSTRKNLRSQEIVGTKLKPISPFKNLLTPFKKPPQAILKTFLKPFKTLQSPFLKTFSDLF